MRTNLLILLFLFGLAASAQSALQPSPLMGKPYETPMMAVPTTLTALATADAKLIKFTIYNGTASAITVSICSRESTPVCVLSTGTSIAAGQLLVGVFGDGILMTSGFTWIASASGVTGAISAAKP